MSNEMELVWVVCDGDGNPVIVGRSDREAWDSFATVYADVYELDERRPFKDTADVTTAYEARGYTCRPAYMPPLCRADFAPAVWVRAMSETFKVGGRDDE